MNDNNVKICVLSPYVPYDNMLHAGGKIHNYIMNMIIDKYDVDLSLLAVGRWYEQSKVTIHTKIKTKIWYLSFWGHVVRSLFNKFVFSKSSFSKWAFFGYPHYRGHFVRYMRKLKREGYCPDVVVLEWPEVGLMIDDVKSLFPTSKIAINEVDVTYLGIEREVARSSGFRRYVLEKQYRKEKQAELNALKNADLVICNNKKDSKLVIGDGVSEQNVFVLVPFYESMRNVRLTFKTEKILFWGSMRRSENYNGAIWFIKKVFPQLSEQYQNVSLEVVGNRPPPQLQSLASKRVNITGYVEHVEEYFENASIFAAPLFTGAGIKIKVIEAMSAGLPVVTTNVGIEGIPAEDKKHFFLANTEVEFAAAICWLLANKDAAMNMGMTAQAFVLENFNYEKSVSQYIERLIALPKR